MAARRGGRGEPSRCVGMETAAVAETPSSIRKADNGGILSSTSPSMGTPGADCWELDWGAGERGCNCEKPGVEVPAGCAVLVGETRVTVTLFARRYLVPSTTPPKACE